MVEFSASLGQFGLSEEKGSSNLNFYYFNREKQQIFHVTGGSSKSVELTKKLSLTTESPICYLSSSKIVLGLGHSEVTEIAELNLENESINSLENLPFPCKGGQLHYYEGNIFYVGGVSEGVSHVMKYSIKKKNWDLDFEKPEESKTEPKSESSKGGKKRKGEFKLKNLINTGSVLHDKKIYFVGGQRKTSSGALKPNFKVYSLEISKKFKLVDEKIKLPFAVLNPCIGGHGKKLIVTAGTDLNNEPSISACKIDLKTKTVKIIDSLFVKFYENYPAIVTSDFTLFVSAPACAVRFKDYHYWFIFMIRPFMHFPCKLCEKLPEVVHHKVEESDSDSVEIKGEKKIQKKSESNSSDSDSRKKIKAKANVNIPGIKADAKISGKEEKPKIEKIKGEGIDKELPKPEFKVEGPHIDTKLGGFQGKVDKPKVSIGKKKASSSSSSSSNPEIKKVEGSTGLDVKVLDVHSGGKKPDAKAEGKISGKIEVPKVKIGKKRSSSSSSSSDSKKLSDLSGKIDVTKPEIKANLPGGVLKHEVPKGKINVPTEKIGKVHSSSSDDSEKHAKGDVNIALGKKSDITAPKVKLGTKVSSSSSDSSTQKKNIKVPEIHDGVKVDLEGKKSKDLGIKAPEIHADIKKPEAKGDLKAEVPKSKVDVPKVKIGKKKSSSSSSSSQSDSHNKKELGVKLSVDEKKKSDIKADKKGEIKVGLPKGKIEGHVELGKGSSSSSSSDSKKGKKIDTKLPGAHIEKPEIKAEKSKGFDVKADVNISKPSIGGPKAKIGKRGSSSSSSDSKNKKTSDLKAPHAHVDIKKPEIKVEKPQGADLNVSGGAPPHNAKEDVDIKESLPKVKLGKKHQSSSSSSSSDSHHKRNIKGKLPTVNVDIKKPDISAEKLTKQDKKNSGDTKHPELKLDANVATPKIDAPKLKFIKKGSNSSSSSSSHSHHKKGVNVKLPEGNVDIKKPNISVEEPKGKDLKLSGKIDSDLKKPEASASVNVQKPKIDEPKVKLGKKRESSSSSSSSDSHKKKGFEVKIGVDIKKPEIKGEKHKNLDIKADVKGDLPKGKIDIPKVSTGKKKSSSSSSSSLNSKGKKFSVDKPDLKIDKNINKDSGKIHTDLKKPEIKGEFKGPKVNIGKKFSSSSSSSSGSHKKRGINLTGPDIKGSVKVPEIKATVEKPEAKLDVHPQLDVHESHANVKIPEVKVNESKPESKIGFNAKIGIPDVKIGKKKSSSSSSDSHDKKIKIEVPGPHGHISKNVDVKPPDVHLDTEKSKGFGIKAPEIHADVHSEKPKEIGIKAPEIHAEAHSEKKKGFGIKVPEIHANITADKQTDVKVPEIHSDKPKGFEIKAPEVHADKQKGFGIKVPEVHADAHIEKSKGFGVEVPEIHADKHAEINVPAIHSGDSKGFEIKAPEFHAEGHPENLIDLGVKVPEIHTDISADKNMSLSHPEIHLEESKEFAPVLPEIDPHINKPEISANINLESNLDDPRSNIDASLSDSHPNLIIPEETFTINPSFQTHSELPSSEVPISADVGFDISPEIIITHPGNQGLLNSEVQEFSPNIEISPNQDLLISIPEGISFEDTKITPRSIKINKDVSSVSSSDVSDTETDEIVTCRPKKLLVFTEVVCEIFNLPKLSKENFKKIAKSVGIKKKASMRHAYEYFKKVIPTNDYEVGLVFKVCLNMHGDFKKIKLKPKECWIAIMAAGIMPSEKIINHDKTAFALSRALKYIILRKA